MKQHAIPQNILDIEFKLFTKFTVREFTYMAVGIGFGGIFLYMYSKGDIPGIVAFPIFLTSSAIGLFLGLVPINDQKADVFLRNYITAITSPTQRVWKNAKLDQKLGKPTLPNETKAGMERGVAANKPKIVGTSQASDQGTKYIEDEKLQALDNEEAQKLAQISKEAVQAGVGSTTPLPKDIPVQNQQAQQPVPNSSNISINSQNISNFEIALPDGVVLNGSLNMQILNKENTPVSGAVATIKDSTGRVLSAFRANDQGYILTNKILNPGTYYINVKDEKNTYPQVQVLLDGNSIKPFKITAI